MAVLSIIDLAEAVGFDHDAALRNMTDYLSLPEGALQADREATARTP